MVKYCRKLEAKISFFTFLEEVFLAMLCDYFMSESVFWYMTARYSQEIQTIRQFNKTGKPICIDNPEQLSLYLKHLELDLVNPIHAIQDYPLFSCALCLFCEAARFAATFPLTLDGTEYLYVMEEQLTSVDGGHSFYQDFPLIDTFSHFQSKVFQAGLWSYWKQLFENAVRDHQAMITFKLPLDTSSLMVCLRFWVFSCLIGIVVLLLELKCARWKLRNKRKSERVNVSIN